MEKQTVTSPAIQSDNSFPVVGIGASAGGLDAFKKLLRVIPEDSGMAYVLIQHLDPNHESILPELLQKITRIPVLEIENDIEVKPNHIYVIPSNKIMVATDGVLLLAPRPGKSKTERHMPIDLFFTSLAEVHQSHAIGVILSGTATDGTLGLKAIKVHGGMTFAQDEASANFGSMPNSAVNAGVVDFILPPDQIAAKLMEVVSILQKSEIKTDSEHENTEAFKRIITLLRIRKGTDFTYYKQSTIKRRILRRLAINKMGKPLEYYKFLQENTGEQDVLYQDLLISVTAFFRDTLTFDNMCKTIIPNIINSRPEEGPIRVWVAGCSTGQEAYSIAICFKERLANSHRSVQIFATDISEPAIAKARLGIYSKTELADVSPKRMQEHFTKNNGGFQLNKNIREMCVFAKHDFLKDPPFGKMDLITCRNVLIYMEPYLQKKALTTFHYSLNPSGYLLLGKSETISCVPDLFGSVLENDKIFIRKNVQGKFVHVATERTEQNMSYRYPVIKNEIARSDFQKAADEIVLQKYTPSGVVVNEAFDIVYYRGVTTDFLVQASRKPSHNLMKLAKPGLAFELRNILHKAKKAKATYMKEDVPVEIGGHLQNISIEAIPLENTIEPHFLILFHEKQMGSFDSSFIRNTIAESKTDGVDKRDLRITQLEQELVQSREDMRAITEEQEAANEELQSVNEELLSGSEELQSLNEELETNKEELQSTNEELTVVNHEIISLNEQVTEARDYAEAIIATIHEPMLVLTKDFRVKFANSAFYANFRVNEKETEGVLLSELGNGQWNIPRLHELLNEILFKNSKFQDLELSHNFPSIGERHMLLNASRIVQKSNSDLLILLAIHDITEIKRLSADLQLKEKKMFDLRLEGVNESKRLTEESNKRYNLMLLKSPFAFGVLKGKQMKVEFANTKIKEYWGKGNNIEGQSIYTLLPEIKDGEIPKILEQVYSVGIPYHGYELLTPLVRNGKLENTYFNFVIQPYYEVDESVSGVTIISYEVTDQVHAKHELIEAKNTAIREKQAADDAVTAKQQFLSNMSHEIRTPMNAIIGFTNVMMKTELTEQQHEYLNAVKVSGDSLIDLINDILDLAKVDAGKMNFEKIPFSLVSSINSMLLLFESKINEKNILLVKEFDAAIPDKLIGDPLRLRQIILNLLSNAVKFTAKGKITCEVKVIKEAEEAVVIDFRISDTGIGIPPERQKLIFEDFGQAAYENSRLYGGTGLGLSIVKKLVELQGGKISVESKEGEGSVFTVQMSFVKMSKAEEHLSVNNSVLQEENDAAILKSKVVKVLVAEDMALNQMLIKIILTDFGFEVDMAENGKKAIELLKTNKYDLILMDLQMPEMNGFSATEIIRLEMNSKIPIIALTADVTSIDVEKCKEVGMNDYISKPIDEKLLYHKILNCLK